MNVLDPPESYIRYRCATRSLSGQELTLAQERFYKKEFDSRAEISQLFDWLEQQRADVSLPYERIVVKNGHSERLMIYDIEYWNQGGRIVKRKIYLANQGQLAIGETEEHKPDRKAQAAGDFQEEVPF